MKRTFQQVMCGIAAVCAVGSTMAPLSAQEREESRWTASFGAGFTVPAYNTGTRHDNGWNLSTGAGVNLFSSHVGLVGEFMYNSVGINSATLQSLQFPGGDTHIWAFTADPVIRFNPHGPVDFYLIGGPGVYHRNVEFTQPAVGTFTAFDPFFGVFYPAAVPVNQVLLAYSTTKLGVNGGGGLTVRLGNRRAKFFAEARYHQMYTKTPTTLLPVTMGIRW